MILWIRKAELRKALLCCGGFLCAAFVFHALTTGLPVISAFSTAEKPPVTVVIDPGHGGEDGGAVSPGGVQESHINLAVSKQLRDLLRFAGVPTAMTREEDVTICDEGLGTIRARKASDIRNRVAIVNGTENAVLLSIHQNTFPEEKYSGAQVFFAKTEGSRELAQKLQAALVTTLNPGSNRKSKACSGVYLMEHIACTGVLIECGFLSNPQEEAKLRSSDYQKRLCCVIAATLSQYVSNT